MIYPEGSFCGKCKVSSSVKPLKHCARCTIAKYCSKDCQLSDFKTHKNDCKKVEEIKKKLDEIEPFLKNVQVVRGQQDCLLNQDFPPGVANPFKSLIVRDNSKAENVFETRVAEFSKVKNRFLWDPLSKNPAEIWPRDYIVIRMRRAEAMWRIANLHADKEAVKRVLDELLEIVRLDAYDLNHAFEMIAFIFLSLGQIDEAYNVVKFRIMHQEDHDFIVRKGKQLKPGEWLRFEEQQDKREDLMRSISHEKHQSISLGFFVCLFAIKVKIILDMKKQLKKDFSFKQRLKDQTDQLHALGQAMNQMNRTMLPALVNPRPLLLQPIQLELNYGKPSEAADVLQYSWQFFDKTEGSKKIVMNLLDPHWKEGQPWPIYDSRVNTKLSPGFNVSENPYDKTYSFNPHGSF